MPAARLATLADVEPLGAALGRAFATDPIWRWIVPDDGRWDRGAARAFAVEVALRVRQGHTYTTDDRAGAALWAPPGLWRGSLLDQLRVAPAMGRLVGRAGLRPGTGLLRAMERAHARHRTEPHWYLAILGTDPPQQGRGVASALLQPVLDRADLDGAGAYLESSNPGNVAFYEGHGFTVVGQAAHGGSPPLDLMWRDPKDPHR